MDGSEFGVENVTPYAMGGDENGDYYPTPISSGVHVITATAYTQSDGNGQSLSSVTVILTVSGSSPAPNPTPTPAPSSDKLIALHYDHAPDPDDGLATAAGHTVAEEWGLNTVVVGGTTGENTGDYVSQSEQVMNAVWGSGNWLNAHNNWNSSVQTAADRWQSALNSGADVWVAEGGQSDFSADVVRELKSRNSSLDTRNRIHVVQHSNWNEDMTTDSDLSYVKNNTDYIKIADGNDDNGTADLCQGDNGWFRSVAEDNSKYGSGWSAAFDYFIPRRYENVVDFSDTVELLYILGISKNQIGGIDDFAEEFLVE
jgi:hypothetical protein